MSAFGSGSRAVFVMQPPASLKVGQEFTISIRASHSRDNGTMGFVTLARSGSRSHDSSRTSDFLGGTSLVGNWDRGPPGSDTMEFTSIKVTQPGSYYLKIHLYSEPKDKGDGNGPQVEHLGIVCSQGFNVRAKSPSSRGSRR
ncbi:hypothetical protein F4804DRAFT_323973 [Jackrogersella minutella]|nr:hypothetical protein F4804DRAFT_323973 [Jackrogersella minutella]